MAARRRNGEGTVFKRADGLWVARFDLPEDGTGRRRRWQGTSRTQADALKKMREARRQVEETGSVAGKSQKVSQWLDSWIDTHVTPRLRPGTAKDYRTTVSTHIKPRLGGYRLNELTPAHVRKMHADVLAAVSLATANKAHRVLRASLSDAEREGLVVRNVAKLVQTPTLHSDKRALTSAEGQLVIKGRPDDRMRSRWSAALLTGARQGECLGLTWDCLNLDTGVMDISWQLQTMPMKHGCKERDGRPSCKKTRASACPDAVLDIPAGLECRQLDGIYCLTRPKSFKGQRLIPIPSALVEQLRQHRRESIAYPNPHGLVWAKEDGRPISKTLDYQRWSAMLEDLGIQHVGLHNARHTTATLLMDLGVDVEIIRSIMGHAQVTTTRGYQHADLRMARAALDELGQALA